MTELSTQAVIMVDDKVIPIVFSLDELEIVTETIEIGGVESDDDFNSRRNSFGNWLFGLPKERKVTPKVTYAGRAIRKPLTVYVTKEDKIFFDEWLYAFHDIYDYKKDFIIKIDGIERYSFLGTFPLPAEEGSIDSKVILSYDMYRILE